MEKIQAAIAKARSARERQEGPAKSTPGTARPQRGAADHAATSRRDPTLPEENAADYEVPAISPDIIAAWQELQAFSPNVGHLARHRVVSFGGDSASVTSDILRTKILQQMRANNWRRLAVTSPSAGCGKSTVVTNLAFSLSRQAELRTIVCEMNMRRPDLATILGLTGTRSFARVLSGESYFRAEAVKVRPNLAFAVNQVRVRNSAELLQGPTIRPALTSLVHHYAPDVMIFDLPAMDSSDDTMAFMGQVDCVMIVAAAGKTSLRAIDRCETELAQQTNVLGVVLNKCRYMDKDYA